MKEISDLGIIKGVVIFVIVGVTVFFTLLIMNWNVLFTDTTHGVSEIDERRYISFERQNGQCVAQTTPLNSTHCLRFVTSGS